MLDWTKALDISPLISEEIAVFPGDQEFKRKILLDMENDDHLTLSSIESTVHLGAHTDAPNHYSAKDIGIDEVSFEAYLGDCQVIEVNNLSNGLIKKENFTDKIIAPRVLFKNWEFFQTPTTGIMILLPSILKLLIFLGDHKVKLVGIDTPSIDPASAKTLTAHHRVAKHKMAILEGIVLTKVLPGLYGLIALPLKLKNCDASPVRAILLPRS